MRRTTGAKDNYFINLFTFYSTAMSIKEWYQCVQWELNCKFSITSSLQKHFVNCKLLFVWKFEVSFFLLVCGNLYYNLSLLISHSLTCPYYSLTLDMTLLARQLWSVSFDQPLLTCHSETIIFDQPLLTCHFRPVTIDQVL